MEFDGDLLEGRLIRRYQRFLADVELADGSTVTAHTPNTGSMMGCCTPGSRVWLRDSGNPARKYRHSWELVEAGENVLVGINTVWANRLAQEAIEQGSIEELQGYSRIRREIRYGEENSRIDLRLEGPAGCCYVEVKNVTLVDRGTALFPDAVSRRGTKHLRELATVVRSGDRAVIFYCVQRGDAAAVRPADAIDPVYGRSLREAVAAGVEPLAYRAHVSLDGIRLETALPVVLA
ncbi:MAG: DNA/RNA nuclease SfsA [Methylococcaceae bacterium]|nr:DNA/RNA nuclease SfsA [Methylococcaceae bacterium]